MKVPIRRSSSLLIKYLILLAGRTPLHCAASCNDRNLCEFLVRNGAAVVAMTQSDGATASQKCDPYAVGFEECEIFLRGEESPPGVCSSTPAVTRHTSKTEGMNHKMIVYPVMLLGDDVSSAKHSVDCSLDKKYLISLSNTHTQMLK